MSTRQPPAQRHASWIELFFDLVVVAGVLQLSHLLHDGPTVADLGLYVVLYLAFWIAWVCFTVYGNVEGSRAWTPGFLLGMFGLAVMVAAVPGIRTDHALAFAIAYAFLRWLSGRLWRPGQVVVDWPLAQVGGGTLPWIVSLWVDAPVRYWLWALGLAFDLLIMLTASGSRMLRDAQERVQRVVRKRGHSDRLPVIEAAYSDVPHMVERLGLFVIIVLGEGVVRITSAAADTVWDVSMAGVATGSFVLLVALWSMSLLHGSGGVPKPGPDDLPVRVTLTLHCVTTCTIAVLAAGLGLAIAHPHGPAPDEARWLLCAGLAVYFGVGVLAAAMADAPWGQTLAWALPCLLLTFALAGFAGHFGAVGLVWGLAAAVIWQIACVSDAGARLRVRTHS
ncbi:low temperature requirement protein A [Streptomyces sp. NBC_01637]|uniref:low temperature requirement protein A n=1 Tax=unclassified Streptomyces TaxID=2593676 RepID=UPI00386CDF5B|nr:low temperature requirement protein A [Streptomyces sp. NBC_01653]WTD87200.1 low temperature requirement protein A [Streptomyces sp. NBC_01637]